ncbi:E3 ubiquitin-protein ligase RNF144A-like [Mangifera indica]|uniref:E3 ubiquitin-protein ligase RNF144A-like n=1 Tax=Mangifera indica TaxID=29780 RepID=UPI001CFB4390|nr:E3 ubiquitin-protein ligase RNF144A-like [Mangifera indica]XP_044472353.1 E3 ubiquitin-protein ligase RNF144A-like [Mangifera indica]
MNNPIEPLVLEYDGFVFRPRTCGSTNGTAAAAISADHFTGFKSFELSLKAATTFPGKPFSNPSVTESGQSSNSKNDDVPPFVCSICVEPKTANDSFNIKGCPHSYCKTCIAKYVGSKLQENNTSIPCPESNCGGLLEPEYCRSILPQDVFDRWGNALCDAVIPEAQRFYCPYRDCSALMIDDGGEVIRKSKCANCRRKFCAQCKVAWHKGLKCRKFQKLKKYEGSNEDIMVMKLAEKKKWKRCPHCNYFVEKKSGCAAIQCRCGDAFCYNCGTPIIPNTHGCPKCYQTDLMLESLI